MNNHDSTHQFETFECEHDFAGGGFAIGIGFILHVLFLVDNVAVYRLNNEQQTP